MDLRGHKLSEDGDISIAIFAKDIIGLLDKLEIDKAHIIGHSMGGFVCQDLLVNYPQRVLSCILSSTACFTKFEEGKAMIEERLKFIDAYPMEQVGAIIASRACMPDLPQSNPQVYEEIVQLLSDNRKSSYRQSTIEGANIDFREQLKKVEVPVLILAGQMDQVVSLPFSRLINEILIGSKLQILPNCGHLSTAENAEGFNQAAAEFYAANEPFAALPLLGVAL